VSYYADYVTERTNDIIYESDKGFIVFRYLSPEQVYIVDLYVSHEYRLTNVASEMVKRVVNIAKATGRTELVGSVVPSCKNATESLHACLHRGMKVVSSSDNVIILKKGI
jgi:predicted GNAT family acetyltransferase